MRLTLTSMIASRRWAKHPDISAFIDRSRLNVSKALPEHFHRPEVQEAIGRLRRHGRRAMENLERFLAEFDAEWSRDEPTAA